MKKGATTRKNKAPKGFAAVSISKAYGRQRDFHTTLPCSFVSPHQVILGQLEHSIKFLQGPITEDDYDLIFSIAKFEGCKPPEAWLDTPGTVHGYFSTYEESQDFVKKLASEGKINETKFGPTPLASLLTPTTAPSAISAMPVLSLQSGVLQEIPLPATFESSQLAHFIQSYSPDEETSHSITLHQSDANDVTPDVPGTELMTSHEMEGTSSTHLSKSDVTDCLASAVNQISNMMLGLETRVMEKLDNHNNRLTDVESKLAVLQKQIADLTVHLANEHPPVSLTGITTLSQKYEFDIPFANLDSFLVFDEKLKGEMFEEVKTYLMITHLKSVAPMTNCYKLFHFFFTKDVLANCTPVQKSGTKIIFKKTQFYSCLLDAFTSLYFESKFDFSDEILLGFVKSVIKNNGDWGKGRAMRMKSKSESEVTVDDSPAKRQRLNEDSQQQIRSPLKDISHNVQRSE